MLNVLVSARFAAGTNYPYKESEYSEDKYLSLVSNPIELLIALTQDNSARLIVDLTGSDKEHSTSEEESDPDKGAPVALEEKEKSVK